MNISLENDEQFLPVREFIAGKLKVTYEEGRLRYIKYDGNEVIRMIYPALRDENWKTIPYIIQNEKIEERKEGISIRYEAVFEALYKADIELMISHDGTLSFEMKGKSISSFNSKRIGICVLHPITSCAGRTIEIIKPDGRIEKSIFPVLISPRQPFTDITGMRWVSADNIHSEILFEGDHFETEDQRNWTDDSYKTYSGPLYKVNMLNIAAGDSMKQKVVLKMKKISTEADTIENTHTKGSDKKFPFPQIGYPYPGAGNISVTEKLPHDHLLAEIDLSDPSSLEKIRVAGEDAAKNKMLLRLNILFDSFSEEEVNNVSNAISSFRQQIKSVLILSVKEKTPAPDDFVQVYNILKKVYPEIMIGFGSSTWFAELNRNMPVSFTCDFVGFIISPQAHLPDHRTILENLHSQHTILDTIREKLADMPVHISVKFNTVYDERWHTNFGAWWLMNTIVNFADAPVITFYDLNKKNSLIYRVLEKVKQFKPVQIFAERNTAVQDPMQAIRETKVFLENISGERLCFTMKDI